MPKCIICKKEVRYWGSCSECFKAFIDEFMKIVDRYMRSEIDTDTAYKAIVETGHAIWHAEQIDIEFLDKKGIILVDFHEPFQDIRSGLVAVTKKGLKDYYEIDPEDAKNWREWLEEKGDVFCPICDT